MDILDDIGVSTLSAKAFFKVYYPFKKMIAVCKGLPLVRALQLETFVPHSISDLF